MSRRAVTFSTLSLTGGGCGGTTSQVDLLENHPPVIQQVTATPDTVRVTEASTLTCTATDEDGDTVTLFWTAGQGSFPKGDTGKSVEWRASSATGDVPVTVRAFDGDHYAERTVDIHVDGFPSRPELPVPVDRGLGKASGATLRWDSRDPEGGPLLFDVFFGENQDPPLVSAGQEEAFLQTVPMSAGATFYWKVRAVDRMGNVTEGGLWSFRAAEESQGVLEVGDSGVLVEMVWIEPDTFTMGASWEEGAGDDESPSHLVTLEQGFWMGKYEVTQGEFQALMGQWSFAFPGPRRPAENVSWEDAQAFVDAANRGEDGNPWRLPTEAEWEFVARGGVYDARFWWENDPGLSQIGAFMWFDQNSGRRTHDVGTTPGGPNLYGLWDMQGNVFEWCEDWYHGTYAKAPTDGSAWLTPAGTDRALRGGSFGGFWRWGRPALRSFFTPDRRVSEVGFRLVRDAG